MMPMKGPQGTPAPPLVAYCERHLPPDQAAAREASLEAEAEEEEEEEGGVGAPLFELRRSRSLPARTPRRTGPPSPSFPPSSSTASSPTPERFSSEFVSSREARRGAPLLERLHREPWRRPGKRPLPRASLIASRSGGPARRRSRASAFGGTRRAASSREARRAGGACGGERESARGVWGAAIPRVRAQRFPRIRSPRASLAAVEGEGEGREGEGRRGKAREGREGRRDETRGAS